MIFRALLGVWLPRFHFNEAVFVNFAELTLYFTNLINMDYSMTILQYARKFEEYRAVADPAKRREILDQIPLPTIHRFSPKNPSCSDYDQDRVHLSATDAIRYKRIFGLVSSVKFEHAAAGALTPASAQIVTKISWRKASAQRWERGFFRTTAYSAAFTHPRADGSSAHIALGMAIVGIVEAPHSSKMSANLISRYRATYDEWRSNSPHSLMTPAQREALLDQDLTSFLP